ncbi:hypothetical protein CYOC110262_10220 [Cytobacillus oceanisediminis]|uniref:Uncharacterized protein n=1 Tax=Cytobacillus oceanisediminis TaxID=665099 RepID=A0A562K3B6_9BACI|nr:hypothetical protein IQ19_00971 [Cytobacillus oceanisediminis]
MKNMKIFLVLDNLCPIIFLMPLNKIMPDLLVKITLGILCIYHH